MGSSLGMKAPKEGSLSHRRYRDDSWRGDKNYCDGLSY